MLWNCICNQKQWMKIFFFKYELVNIKFKYSTVHNISVSWQETMKEKTTVLSKNKWKTECCGSGAVCFRASRIQIHHYILRIRIWIQQAKKVRKTLDFYNYDSFPLFDFLPMKTDVNLPSRSNQLKNFEKNFLLHLVSHWRKRQDPDPDP